MFAVYSFIRTEPRSTISTVHISTTFSTTRATWGGGGGEPLHECKLGLSFRAIASGLHGSVACAYTTVQ